MLFLLLLFSSTYGYDRFGVYPTKYYLKLTPNFDNYTFEGDLSIHLVVNNSDTIILDCEDLNVTSTTLFVGGLDQFLSKAQENNSFIVNSRNPLNSSEVELNVMFRGSIRNDMTGFYLSTYQFEGKERILGSTQFESNGARKAFPCFDEPSFRADFSLELIIPSNMGAISNQPANNTVDGNGMKTIKFNERPSTPTYLIAWIIYDTESYGHVSKNVTSRCDQNKSQMYSIWYVENYQNETSLALNAAPEIVSAMENFTDVYCEAVKLKMDLAAIPDFSPGAMENWEIITFRESALLYNNVTSSVSDKQSILMTVAHEIVHQWFGDLVTLEWWSYTWLNEGFARYFQYFIIDQLYPEMSLMEQFLVNVRQSALATDNLQAHPLTNHNITSQDDIDNMFDVITYDKGASVIHMWRSTIGDDQFRGGINHYLNSVSSGGVSVPGYLFSALFSNTTWNNNELGLTWTLQSGYPIVEVTESNSTLTLSQLKVTGWNTTNEGQWLIPITLTTNNNKTVSHKLEPNSSLEIELDPNTTYIINSNQIGFYRVMYRNIGRWLPTETTDLTRSMLIDDAMALSNAGLLSYETSMNVVSHHLKSSGYLPWASALRAFSIVDKILKGSELEPRWRELVLNLMDNIMRKVALNDSLSENHILMLHKINLLKYGCMFENYDCLVEAGKLASNISSATPEQREAFLCSVVRLSNETTWNQIFVQYNSSNSPTEKQSYLRALTCTRDRTIIKKFLQIMLTKEIRKQDIVSTVKLVCESPEGAEETLNFIQNNYQRLLSKVNEPKNIREVLSAATNFANDSTIEKIKLMAPIAPQFITTSFINKLEKQINLKKFQVQALSDFLLSAEVATTEKPSESHADRLNVDITSLIYAVLYITICIYNY